MAFFAHREAAHRYHRHRPKLHAQVLDTMKPLLGPLPVQRALDVACGSGDSAQALHAYAREITGVDSSDTMLQYAKQHRHHTYQLAAEDLGQLRQRFDLLGTCMAFHWFDQTRVIPAYKSVTQDGGHWIIYNIGFEGQPHSEAYQQAQKRYLRDFPTPARQHATAQTQLQNDPEIHLLSDQRGQLEHRFERSELIAYLCTQSNVEAAVQAGQSYASLERALAANFAELDFTQPFLFHYRAELFRYQPTLASSASGPAH